MATSVDFTWGSVPHFPNVLAACAAYHRLFEEWPTDLHVHRVHLRWFAQMPEERWMQLTHRMALHTEYSWRQETLVTGPAGKVHSEVNVQTTDWKLDAMTEVERWLSTASAEPEW